MLSGFVGSATASVSSDNEESSPVNSLSSELSSRISPLSFDAVGCEISDSEILFNEFFNFDSG